jgi:hypothetical protein
LEQDEAINAIIEHELQIARFLENMKGFYDFKLHGIEGSVEECLSGKAELDEFFKKRSKRK